MLPPPRIYTDPRTYPIPTAIPAMQKVLKNVTARAAEGNTWKKFTTPKVSRGKTAFPSSPAQQEQLGVRFDYDGEITKNDTVYHKFQMQPNAGKIPTSIQHWREANGGPHAVMASVYVKKDGTEEDVKQALEAGRESVKS